VVKMSNTIKPLIVWDESELVDDELIERLQQQEEDIGSKIILGIDAQSEDDIRACIYEDSTFFQDQWEYMTDYLSEIMLKINPKGYECWMATVKGFGWRNSEGAKLFKAANSNELLSNVLPTYECTFHIFKEGDKLKIRNWHHDSPTGNEYYYISPIKACICCGEPVSINRKVYCDECKVNIE